MPQPSRIAIVGAGPAGLTLARILHRAGIASTVLERDPHALARPQGGTLDLHADTGQFAFNEAGLSAEFERMARYEDQGSRLYDKDGSLIFADDDAEAGDRPEIDRTALREILLASLPPDTILWGRSLSEVRPEADGRYGLVTESGVLGPFDLVVGADGAWSKVRPLVSRYEPQYSGLTFIEFGIDDADRRHPRLSALVGRGKMGAEGEGRSLIVQRNGHAHLRGYAIFRVPMEWVRQNFDVSRPDKIRTRLLAEFEGWAPQFLELFRASNDLIVPRPIHALPVSHHWTNRPGVTLIGDAAHVMSPFGGEGVNAAMRDAAELGRRLCGSMTLVDAVKSYEEEMFTRVADAARDAAEAAATELSHVGLQLTLHTMKEHVQQRQPVG